MDDLLFDQMVIKMKEQGIETPASGIMTGVDEDF